jgi:ribosomal protein S18 acetylase RimI-like enzyme
MTADDIEDVLALWNGMPGIGLNESDTPENLRAFLTRNAGLSLVVRDGERPARRSLIGAVLCGHDGRRGYLHHLAVRPEYRRRGLARQMVEKCLAALREQGIIKCNIFVYAENDDGQGFWSRCGWNHRSDLIVLQRMTGDCASSSGC